MLYNNEDTIAAIATPPGDGGIGIVRVSGPEASFVVDKIFQADKKKPLKSHQMYHGWLKDPAQNRLLDKANLCFMKAPRSYTGEDILEIFCHGGRAVLERVLEAVLSCKVRLAEKGEFSKRAFLNGKLDLTQAEAVLDLVKAETKKSAGFALMQLEGKLSQKVNKIRNELIGLISEIEVAIDFEEEVKGINVLKVKDKIDNEIKIIDEMLKTSEAGKIFRNGLATVIIGKPNVGKSSLMNALLDEERVIVTSMPGTTRDAIEEVVNINGMPLKIIDTAGIREPKDEAERVGVERAKKEAGAAEFFLVVIDSSNKVDDLDRQVLREVEGKKAVVVLNKKDLGNYNGEDGYASVANGHPAFPISAKYKDGIRELKDCIYTYVEGQASSGKEGQALVNMRHKECLMKAREALYKASMSCSEGLSPDFIAIDLKDAVVALGEVTGEIVSDEIINTVFEQFCVGK
ncbi:MAG: tRNA uridine-5-carboxymethylaminomethyl(34) synthesis GTPase MnmE [Candidatus Margulisiibacteriota bacterium]|nr:tRNA uridine-5-carboxymethylaminomethyl(34) synthesis GTPase MnmE [Candidatus Margulisiibacteriota bacterium]